MAFIFNIFAYLIFTVVTPIHIFGQETQAQSLSDSCLDSGTSNVQISIGNLECRSSKPCKISYLVGTQRVPWSQAYILCKHSGMELASVSSIDEELALENSTRTAGIKVGFYEGYWISGTRHGACGSDFVWFTTGKPVIYRKFSAGQPDNAGANEACLELFLNSPNVFAWNDAPCDIKLGFVCQSTCP